MIEPTVHSRPKSKLAALALGFFFGPLGLFYVTTPGKVILMVLGAALLGAGTDGVAWFLAMIGVAIYAAHCGGAVQREVGGTPGGSHRSHPQQRASASQLTTRCRVTSRR